MERFEELPELVAFPLPHALEANPARADVVEEIVSLDGIVGAEHLHAIFDVVHLIHELVHVVFGLVDVCANGAEHGESMRMASGDFYTLARVAGKKNTTSAMDESCRLAALQEECRRVEEFNRETESLDRRLAALRHQEECRRMEEFRLETESLDRRLAALRAHENKRRAGNV